MLKNDSFACLRFALALGATTMAACAPMSVAPDNQQSDAGSSTDAGTPDAGSTDGGADDAAASDGDSGFQPAEHQPLPLVPNNGGRILSAPKFVAITFDGFAYQGDVDSWSDWIVGSDWLNTVGAEYGVGPGTATHMHVPEAAPANITDAQIRAWIQSQVQAGALPTAGADEQYVFGLFYPASTTFTAYGYTSCSTATGYHNGFRDSTGRYAYFVVAQCPTEGRLLQQPDALLAAGSHEFIESAVSADPLTDPAYRLT